MSTRADQMTICLTEQRCHGAKRKVHKILTLCDFFTKEVPNFCLVLRFPRKMSCKSGLCLLLLNTNHNQRIKCHVKIS